MEKRFILKYTICVKIKNFKKDPLFAYPEKSFVTFKTDVQGEKAQINVDAYEDLAGGENGEPVVISCSINNMTHLLCVTSNLVTLKESEVPEEIQSEGSEFLFYKRKERDFSTLESSVKSGFFLAYNEEDKSLILLPYDKDKLDKLVEFLIDGITRDLKRHGKMIPYHIWNNSKDLMIGQPDESIAIFVPDGPDVKEEQATFFMAKYKGPQKIKGLAVALSCKIGKKNFLLWGENNSVILKESEIPEEIPTKTSELIFYRNYFSSGSSSYHFESSFCEKYYLAWIMEGSKKKLILKEYSEEKTDETMKFDLKKPPVTS